MGNLNIQRRAIRDDQKEERRLAILNRAFHLFQTTSYETLTIADVAEVLGLAKGTVYLYFKTKEEIFLSIQEQQLTDFFAEVDARLSELGSTGNIALATSIISDALERRPGLTRLLAILHTILERNIGFDSAVQFKQMLLEHFMRTGALLEQCLPFLATGEGTHLLLQSYVMVIGYWHLADPAPVIQQVLQRPEFQLFQVQFAHEFSTALQTFMYGLEQRARLAKQKEEDL